MGANYFEAQGASSRNDFRNFFSYALKSSNERKFWLALLRDSGLVSAELAEENEYLLVETKEIANIFASSIITMKRKSKNEKEKMKNEKYGLGAYFICMTVSSAHFSFFIFNFSFYMSVAIFLGITFLFFAIRSRPILFHLLCAGLLVGFVWWTGRTLMAGSIGEWIIATVGLILYWFGLTIVRIMLTRSVSLHMLANYALGRETKTASQGIADRLQDARQFGLVSSTQDGYKLTAFGSFIAGIVAFCYWILRIK